MTVYVGRGAQLDPEGVERWGLRESLRLIP
jgi:hypothetical protein